MKLLPLALVALLPLALPGAAAAPGFGCGHSDQLALSAVHPPDSCAVAEAEVDCLGQAVGAVTAASVNPSASWTVVYRFDSLFHDQTVVETQTGAAAVFEQAFSTPGLDLVGTTLTVEVYLGHYEPGWSWPVATATAGCAW